MGSIPSMKIKTTKLSNSAMESTVSLFQPNPYTEVLTPTMCLSSKRKLLGEVLSKKIYNKMAGVKLRCTACTKPWVQAKALEWEGERRH